MFVRNSFLLTGIIMLILFSIGCIENGRVPTTITETPSPEITSTILPTTTPRATIPTSPLTQTSPPQLIFDKSIVHSDISANGVLKSLSLNFSNTGGSGNVEIQVWEIVDNKINSNLTKEFYVLEGGKYNITMYSKRKNVNYIRTTSLYINSTNAEKKIEVISLRDEKWLPENERTLMALDINDIKIYLLSAP